MFRGKLDWPELDIKTIRKISQIVVIDDNEFAYEKLLAKDGFNLKKWDDVDDLNKLSEGYFDVILLDIHGVGRALSTEEGFGVLKHLKENNPTQLIIAFSNADWSLKYQEFFKLADATLSKDKDYVVFKSEIERLLKNRYSKEFYFKRISEIVGDIDTKKNFYNVLEASYRKKDRTILKKYLEKREISSEDMKKIFTIFEMSLNILNIILQAGA